MKYGETVKGDCEFCACEYFFFLSKEKHGYIRVMCKRCNSVQLLKVD